MSIAINFRDELTRCFDLASQRHLAKHLKTGQDWQAGREIMSRYSAMRVRYEKEHYLNFNERVATKTHDLMAKKQAPGRELQDRRYVSGTSNARSIQVQANRMVRAEHQGQLASLEEGERLELRELVGNAQLRGATNQTHSNERPVQQRTRRR